MLKNLMTSDSPVDPTGENAVALNVVGDTTMNKYEWSIKSNEHENN